jgi:hypothetical protein
MLDFVGRIFFPVVHGILLARLWRAVLLRVGIALVRLPGEEHETLHIFGLIESCPIRLRSWWLTIKGYWDCNVSARPSVALAEAGVDGDLTINLKIQ